MRICPYCRSTKIKVVRVMGLAPCNIWNDIVCLDCKERWEENSKIDKIASLLTLVRKGEINDCA